MFPKSQCVPHAVLDELGNELTDPQNIILIYRNEMFRRLQRRLILQSKIFKDYESAINQLCKHRLSKATSNPDFSLSEVQDAISELKERRCIDSTGFV